MRIGIIGAGNVGTTLGSGWAAAGHEIVYGVRDVARAVPHVGARMETVRGTVATCEVLALATPWEAVAATLEAAGDFGGKPLLDVTNPIGPGFTLTHGHTTSGGEIVAGLAKNARVVKAFNSTGVENMKNPRYGTTSALMVVAGDDAPACTVAVTLANDLGFEGVALPSLRHARELEPLAMLWISLALFWGQGRNVAFGLARRTGHESVINLKTTHPQTITIVGSGNIGGALASAWLRAGHTVRLATRDANADDVRTLGALGAKVLPVRGAAAGADVIVFAIPAGAVRETAQQLGDLTGKIVVDCTNAIGKAFTLTPRLRPKRWPKCCREATSYVPSTSRAPRPFGAQPLARLTPSTLWPVMMAMRAPWFEKCLRRLALIPSMRAPAALRGTLSP